MSFFPPPNNFSDEKQWAVQVVNSITSILNGKTNNIGSVTLTANSATTTVTEAPGRIGKDTVILFMPTTANAATEFGAGAMYVSARNVTNKTFTITHVNNAQNDRTFKYVLIG